MQVQLTGYAVCV